MLVLREQLVRSKIKAIIAQLDHLRNSGHHFTADELHEVADQFAAVADELQTCSDDVEPDKDEMHS